MGIAFRYQPPAVDAGILMHGLVAAAETAMAEALLAASQPLVPVDTGELKASGRVEHGADGAAVIYSATNEADGYNYAAKQHEDEDLDHPNGGQPHYLLDPMHQAHAEMLAAAAAVLKLP